MVQGDSNQSVLSDIQEIRRIIGDFESLIKRFESRLIESQQECQGLLQEGDQLVRQAKIQLHDIHERARQCGMEPLPDVDISNEKFRSAWLALYQYHEGATAEEVASRLDKHRTTISTYLNY